MDSVSTARPVRLYGTRTNAVWLVWRAVLVLLAATVPTVGRLRYSSRFNAAILRRLTMEERLANSTGSSFNTKRDKPIIICTLHGLKSFGMQASAWSSPGFSAIQQFMLVSSSGDIYPTTPLVRATTSTVASYNQRRQPIFTLCGIIPVFGRHHAGLMFDSQRQ
jgi:hypothetical protein